MALIENLVELGFSKDEALKRFMNNSRLLERCLKKFVAQAETSTFEEDIKTKNYSAAVESAHSMKGVTGNLSLNSLYERYTKIVDKLRTGDYDGLEELSEEVIEIQKKMCDVIKAEG